MRFGPLLARFRAAARLAGRDAVVLALAALGAAIPSVVPVPAFAHGGNYVPPPPPRGRDTGPSDPGVDPVTTPPDEVVRGPTTPGDWSRWWEFHAVRYLGEDVEPRAALPEKLREKAIGALRRFADDVNEDISTACLVALGKDGDPANLTFILPALIDVKRPAAVRESAVLAIGLLREHDTDKRSLGLLRALASDRDVPTRLRAAAAAALGLRADRSSVVLLARALTFRPEPVDVRTTAASALGLIGDEDSRRLLLAFAKLPPVDETEALVRSYVCQGIARCGGAESVAALRDVADCRDPGVRRAAALALGECAEPGDDATSLKLAALATRDPEREVRAAALLGLGRQAHARSRAALEAAWRRNDELRPFAALGLGLLARRLGTPSAAEILRPVPESKEPTELRGVVLVALGLARDKSALEPACRIASGMADATLQCRAADCIALLRDTGTGAPALRRLLENAKDPILQRHAAAALGRLGDAASSGELIRVLRGSSGLFVRAEAAVSLGRIGGERAVTELLALLEDERTPGLLRAMCAVGIGIAVDRTDGRRLARLGEDLDWARLAPATLELLTIL